MDKQGVLLSEYTQRPEYAKNDLGHFINCKYYGQRVSDDAVEINCEKHGVRNDCEECNTCPKCGGNLYGEPERYYDGRGYYDVYLNKACLQCGARYQGRAIKVPYTGTWGKRDLIPISDLPSCEVEECEKKAWDGHKFKDFDICLKHKRQMRDWKAHPDKGEDRIPLLEEDGLLVENPEYRIKTTPKKLKEKTGGKDEQKESVKIKEVSDEHAVDGGGEKAASGIEGRQGVLPFSFIDSEEQGGSL